MFHPCRDVDLLDVELEEWVSRRRLNHPAYAAAGDGIANEYPGPEYLVRGGPDTQLVVVRARHRVDHAARISPQVVPFGRSDRDGREPTLRRE